MILKLCLKHFYLYFWEEKIMKVSIGVVALNEEKTLPSLFEDFKLQTYPHDEIEIILVDGISTDNTTGEDVSGGKRPNIIDENTAYKRMLLEAESSMFGSSIAPFRNASGKKYVKSMFHAMYKREVLEKVGFFNEKLLRTEDNEFHYRIRKAGYKLCYNDNIVSYQHTRNSLLKMIKQKKANGMWIGLTTAVCPECLNLYHYIPFAFLVALFISIISLFFTKYLFLLVFGSYLIVNVLMSLSSIIKGKFNVYNLLLPIVFFLLHISYGYGTLVGFLKIPSFLKTYNKED